MKTKTLSLLLGIILLASCGKSAPKGDSPEVKKQIVDKVISIIVDKGRYSDKKVLIDALHGKDTRETQQFMTWADNNPFIQNSKEFQLLCDSARTAGLITVKDIRTESIDKEIKKTECKATFSVGVLSFPITYSVQYTEEGKLYVDVSFFVTERNNN